MSERLEQALRTSSAPSINLSMSNSFETALSPRITSDSIQSLRQEEDDDLELEDLDAGIPSNSYCASFANFVLNLPTQFLSMLNTLYSWVASFFNTDAQLQPEDFSAINPILPQATEGEAASSLLNLERMRPQVEVASFSPLLPKSQVNGDALVAALRTLPNEIQIQVRKAMVQERNLQLSGMNSFNTEEFIYNHTQNVTMLDDLIKGFPEQLFSIIHPIVKEFSLNSYVELTADEISDELLDHPENLLKAFKTLPLEIQRTIRCNFASASNLGITGDESYQTEAKLLATVSVQTIESYITRWPAVFCSYIQKEVAKLEEQSFGLFYLLKFEP
jgi:hypothetical protein